MKGLRCFESLKQILQPTQIYSFIPKHFETINDFNVLDRKYPELFFCLSYRM